MNQKDIKFLWGRAGGRCSVPACRTHLAPEGEGGRSVLGEMAHIKGERPAAARWDPDISDADRDGYENRILLCPNHHTMIDSKPEDWPVGRLVTMKAEHEAWVRQTGEQPLVEFEGRVDVEAEGGERVIGVKVTKPTRLKAGTSIRVHTKDVKSTTGLWIGEEKDDI